MRLRHGRSPPACDSATFHFSVPSRLNDTKTGYRYHCWRLPLSSLTLRCACGTCRAGLDSGADMPSSPLFLPTGWLLVLYLRALRHRQDVHPYAGFHTSSAVYCLCYAPSRTRGSRVQHHVSWVQPAGIRTGRLPRLSFSAACRSAVYHALVPVHFHPHGVQDDCVTRCT